MLAWEGPRFAWPGGRTRAPLYVTKVTIRAVGHAILGPFPEITLLPLPKVNIRGHVYPLYGLPYFEDSKSRHSPHPGSDGAHLQWRRLTVDFS